MSPLLGERFDLIKTRIKNAEHRFGRTVGSVTLLAVSKKQSVDKIKCAITLGQKSFAESYLQESLEKMEKLAGIPIDWHFIGPIQSNKIKGIAENFAWVHSVDRLKIAQKLNTAREVCDSQLNVCIQVNFSNESNKSGVVDFDQCVQLAKAIQELPNLKLRGLMAIPLQSSSFNEQKNSFHVLHEWLIKLTQKKFILDTLSMGMTNDLEAAIAEGATIVRVGQGIFGSR